MIHLENVEKKYTQMERPAVKDLSMEIKEGEICVFVGPSGCGKTTTLKMTNLLIRPTGGKIYINGRDVQKQNPIGWRQNIGYVIQQIRIVSAHDGIQQYSHCPQAFGLERKRIKGRTDELLNL